MQAPPFFPDRLAAGFTSGVFYEYFRTERNALQANLYGINRLTADGKVNNIQNYLAL